MKQVRIPTYVVKRGNTYYIKIPHDVAKALGLKHKQQVWVTLEVNGNGK